MIKDTKQLAAEIENELAVLADPEYRQEQCVWAERKQLRLLRQLLTRAEKMGQQEIQDFCRCVADSAPSSARISELAEQLYEVATR